jgi:hypothetical protein
MTSEKAGGEGRLRNIRDTQNNIQVNIECALGAICENYIVTSGDSIDRSRV